MIIRKEILNPDGKITEEMELARYWSKKGLLKGIEDDKLKQEIAICLESQRISNEDNESDPAFNRVIIPALLRALKESKHFAKRPFVQDRELIHYDEYVFSPRFQVPKQCKWQQYNINEEATYVAELSLKIAYVFDTLISSLEKPYQSIAFDCLSVESVIDRTGRMEKGKLLILKYKVVDLRSK